MSVYIQNVSNPESVLVSNNVNLDLTQNDYHPPELYKNLVLNRLRHL